MLSLQKEEVSKRFIINSRSVEKWTPAGIWANGFWNQCWDWWSWLSQQPPASPWAWFNLKKPVYTVNAKKQTKEVGSQVQYLCMLICWLWPNSYLQANNSGNYVECKLHEPQTVLFGAPNSPRRISEQIWK